MGAVAAVGSLVVGAYSASNSKKQGDRMAGLAGRQEDRQAYFANQLIELMKNPSSILDDPGYQLSFGQGLQAVERSSAAAGFTGSGNAAIALQSYGQSFSSKYLREQQSLLASLSGAQFNPAQAYSGASQSYDQSFNQLGGVLASLGYSFGGAGSGSSSGSSGTAPTGWYDRGNNSMSTPGGYIVNVPGSSGSTGP